MNPAKLLDEIQATLARYAPILVVHVVVLILLGFWVLDPAALPKEDSFWKAIEEGIDSALSAIGLSLDRWYVLAAFAIGYLSAFQWTASILASLPLLRIVYRNPYSPQLLGYASQLMPERPAILGTRRRSSDSRPRPYEVLANLQDLVEHFSTEMQESGREIPYPWYLDRLTTWRRRYSAFLVALAGVFLWALEGGSYAVSPDRVWLLLALLAVICVAVRWRVWRAYVDREVALAQWALREFERQDTRVRQTNLDFWRGDLIMKGMAFEIARSRHPAAIARRLLRLLPRKWWKPLRDSLAPLPWHDSADWHTVASAESWFRDEKQAPPQALDVSAFADRFAALLECKGAGLCVLVPRELGLAPAAEGGGAVYSFAERVHGYGALQLELRALDSLADAKLTVRSYGGDENFIANAGPVPVELLAQGSGYHELPAGAKAMMWSRSSEAWPPGSDEPGQNAEELKQEAPLVLGSSYLLIARTARGLRSLVAFQCFRLGDSEKLLVPWRILWVEGWRWEPPEVLPWWRWESWREILRQPEG